MTEIERQLIAELLGERLAPHIDIQTLNAIDNCSPGHTQLNELKLAEVQRIAKESRRHHEQGAQR